MTPAQLQTLKAVIDNTPAWAAFPMSLDGHYALAALLNGYPVTPFYVWSTNVNVQSIRKAITWANLTPVDAPDGTQTWANRSLQCQGKQLSLQLIIPFTGTLDASDAALRNGLSDALANVYSGVGGAVLGAGWGAVRDTLSRLATNVETVFATGNGSTRVLAATMVFEGGVSPTDVQDARNFV